MEWDSELTAPAGRDISLDVGKGASIRLEGDPKKVWIHTVRGRPVVRLRSKGDVVVTVTKRENGLADVSRLLIHGISQDEWIRRGGGRRLTPKPAPDPEPVFEVPPAPVLQEVLRLTNAERIRHGLPPLILMPDLCDAAAVRAREIVISMSHTRPDGSACFTVLKRRGSGTAENIAGGQKTAREVVRAWMDSEGHRANILSPRMTQLGVGYLHRPGTRYRHFWVQLFRR